MTSRAEARLAKAPVLEVAVVKMVGYLKGRESRKKGQENEDCTVSDSRSKKKR